MKTEKQKTVLIALDYDQTAQKVLETGYSMATAMGAKTVLLHVILDPIYYSTTEYSPIMGFTGYMDTVPLQLENPGALKKASQFFLENAIRHLGIGDIETIVKEGDLVDGILKTAKKIDADIIVMGSHSRKWLEDIVLGSSTNDVLQKTTIPLFIVPTKKRK
ncbi:MAG: universal stress protein [Bacteroidales bacterium]|nr:universal stress protein [Bacteroidales bacterium]